MNRFLLFMISLYRSYSETRRPRCRYFPSCSQYSQDAIKTYGSAKGLWITLKRILRCNPIGSYGYDPIPDK